MTKCQACSQEDQWLGTFPTRKRLGASEQDRCVRRLEARTPSDLVPFGKEKDRRVSESEGVLQLVGIRPQQGRAQKLLSCAGEIYAQHRACPCWCVRCVRTSFDKVNAFSDTLLQGTGKIDFKFFRITYVSLICRRV